MTMQNKELDPSRKNRLAVIKAIRKALKEYRAEFAILIMAKEEIVSTEGGEIERKFPMRVIEVLDDKLYPKFTSALGWEIVRLKNIQDKKKWLK